MKPKIDVFCGWGDGPDVGINIFLSKEFREIWSNGLIPLDFTAQEARKLAYKLLFYATEAERMDKLTESL